MSIQNIMLIILIERFDGEKTIRWKIVIHLYRFISFTYKRIVMFQNYVVITVILWDTKKSPFH